MSHGGPLRLVCLCETMRLALPAVSPAAALGTIWRLLQPGHAHHLEVLARSLSQLWGLRQAELWAISASGAGVAAVSRGLRQDTCSHSLLTEGLGWLGTKHSTESHPGPRSLPALPRIPDSFFPHCSVLMSESVCCLF